MVLEVRTDVLAKTRVQEESLEVADDQALLRIERFGCTANNVTYALLAERLGFGKYYPAPPGSIRVPAWGIAEVVETRTNAMLRDRVQATGQQRLDADVAQAWERYVSWVRSWLTVRRAAGADAVRDAFLDVLRGRVAPNEAWVVSMHPAP